MPSQVQPGPIYQRIADEIDVRIRSGDLQPGDRVPSIRQIADSWNVAIATATRVISALRERGLVEAKVGSGTVVSASVGNPRPKRRAEMADPRQPLPVAGGAKRALSRDQLLRRAISIADMEGVGAVSMRRVAADLGVGTMSLYRHVVDKNELVAQMADLVFAEAKLPDPGPEGWRAKLELVARSQWSLCWRHLWLPQAVSLTRPSLSPHMMVHTEWTLQSLDGLGLPLQTRYLEALSLHSLVLAIAVSAADEVEAELETGESLARWSRAQDGRSERVFASGDFPLLEAIGRESSPDLDQLFEYGLARHLDGFAAMVGG